MHPLLQACAIVAALIVLPLAYAFWSAPLGYEDDAGFHVIGGGGLRNLRGDHANLNTISQVQDHGA